MNEGLVVIVRSVISFFSLLIFTKILGKQQISQLAFFDYVLGITIGSIAATLTTDLSSRAWPHWVGLITWAVLSYLMEVITMKWIKVGEYVDGKPTIVIKKGKIMEDSLKKMKFRAADLLSLLRNKNVFDLSEIEYAILETNGEISIMLKTEHQPLTPKDMKIKTEPLALGTELIYDGVVLDENLRSINKGRKWLMSELKKYNVKEVSEVFLAFINPTGSLYIDKYNDRIHRRNKNE
ncbi:DUF421 domain-containing protein [Clostridium malenominatum]|uniref:DUF421 domain-containing protein n=1 Tax=Clostridium malenominatum TaxID=1539 RepID=A0ABN1J3J9_9CLOT